VYVEALNEVRADTTRASFDEVPAVLSDADRTTLAKRLRVDESEGTPSALIIGRLDCDEFLDNVGATLKYHHVRLSFDKDGPGQPLEDGDKVLLRAGSILRRKNEVELELLPLDGLDDADVGRDFQVSERPDGSRVVLRMRRRAFSVREDLLPRLETRDKRCLQGSYLYVRVHRLDNGKIEARLRPDILRRDVRALTAALLNSEEGNIFAGYDETAEGKCLLELRPGAVVELDDEQIVYRNQNLAPGAIVQVQLPPDGKGFEIHRAVFSDMRYVSAGQRPVVVLPKNIMAKAEKAQNAAEHPNWNWSGTSSFSIGDLPDIQSELMMPDRRPLNRDMSNFMSRPAPEDRQSFDRFLRKS
jgi:hypothetical protein